jgi:hypothetical protein
MVRIASFAHPWADLKEETIENSSPIFRKIYNACISIKRKRQDVKAQFFPERLDLLSVEG